MAAAVDAAVDAALLAADAAVAAALDAAVDAALAAAVDAAVDAALAAAVAAATADVDAALAAADAAALAAALAAAAPTWPGGPPPTWPGGPAPARPRARPCAQAGWVATIKAMTVKRNLDRIMFRRSSIPCRISYNEGNERFAAPIIIHTAMEESGAPVVKHPQEDASPDAIRSQMIQLLPRLRRFAVALTGSVADGDDLVQDTIERALRGLHQWEPGTRLDNWMFRIARNRFIDARRADARGRMVVMDAPEEAANVAIDGERAMQSHFALHSVSNAIKALPADQREVVALVLIDGLSYREAADILNIPIGTLTSRISRARETLALAIGGDNGA